MNIIIQIDNVPDKFSETVAQIVNAFNGIAGNMIEGKPIVIDFSKLPATRDVADYIADVISSAMALHSMTKL